jgi:hypothetical protein
MTALAPPTVPAALVAVTLIGLSLVAVVSLRVESDRDCAATPSPAIAKSRVPNTVMRLRKANANPPEQTLDRF